jgi:hypothetical protein
MERSARFACSLLAAAILFSSATWPAYGQEVCGLRAAKFGTHLFRDGFEPFVPKSADAPTGAAKGGGLGPPISTVSPPALGVPPSITIVSPGPGAAIAHGRIQVVGTVNGPVGTGVIVNGVAAHVHDGVFATPEFAVGAGEINLIATVTTLDELTATANRTVTLGEDEPDVFIAVDAQLGYAPLSVSFPLHVAASIDVDSLVVQFGDGEFFAGDSPSALPRHTYTTPGIHHVQFIVTDKEANQHTASRRVIVMDLATHRETVCSVYAHLRARLAADDAEGAAQAFHVRHRDRYLELFEALESNRPIAAGRLGTIANGTFSATEAELILVSEEAGELFGFPVRFSQDLDGVWRIESM